MRDQRMVRYVSLVKQRLGSFAAWKLEHIPRNLNEKTDALAAVVTYIPINEMVFLLVYYQPASSITTDQLSQIDKACPSWLTPIIHYLSLGELSDNRVEAYKIKVQVARFSFVNKQLYFGRVVS